MKKFFKKYADLFAFLVSFIFSLIEGYPLFSTDSFHPDSACFGLLCGFSIFHFIGFLFSLSDRNKSNS